MIMSYTQTINLSKFYQMRRANNRVYRMALESVQEKNPLLPLRWDFADEDIAEAVQMIISRLNTSDSDTICFHLDTLSGWFTNGREYTRVVLVDEYENKAQLLINDRGTQMIDTCSVCTEDEITDILLALDACYKNF